MKSTLKLALVVLLMLLTVDRPLKAAIDPLTIGTIVTAGTALGGMLGYLSSSPYDRPEERRRNVAEGCAEGFFMGLLASALTIEAYRPRVYTPYVPYYPVYRPKRVTRTVYRTTTYPAPSLSLSYRMPLGRFW